MSRTDVTISNSRRVSWTWRPGVDVLTLRMSAYRTELPEADTDVFMPALRDQFSKGPTDE